MNDRRNDRKNLPVRRRQVAAKGLRRGRVRRPPARLGFFVRLLQVLGLGAVGFLALLLSRGSGSAVRRGERRGEGADEETRGLWADEDDGEPTFEPSASDAVSWIAGPGGDLRLLERHPGGELHLLLIHGLGGRLEHWLPLLDKTGPAMHCVAVDLPGHGDSDASGDGSEATVESMAQAMRAVLDTLGLRRVIVVGHDLGATVAMRLAAMAPQRVRGLYLVDPNGDQSRLGAAAKEQVLAAMEKDPRDEVRWQFRQILIDAPPAVADRVLADIDSCHPEALLAAVRSSLDFDPAAALRSYGGPCRLLISDLNNLPYSLHKVVPDLPWALLPEASHWMTMDAPQGVWEGLVDFLDRQVLQAS